jgi:predicted nuclease of restriction endonuclease-like (RecB) superfamily
LNDYKNLITEKHILQKNACKLKLPKGNMKEDNYKLFFNEIKLKIKEAQVKTIIVANSQMLLLYWQLGNYILLNQHQQGWGSKIIDLLAKDIKNEFPELNGFSIRNLKYMRTFAKFYSIELIGKMIEIEAKFKQQTPIVQQLVAQLDDAQNMSYDDVQHPAAQLAELKFLQSIIARISWSHHLILIDKMPSIGKRFWYMLNTIEHGISRNVLAMQIESGLYERQIASKKVNNFERTLPQPQTDFANYLLKDPYVFDFVQANEKANERNIEEQLTQHITKFLLELGQGFAFIGKQVHFEIGESDFYVDLLFYHTRLHAYVVVELKARPFEPSDASQLNFYINVVNDKLKTAKDNDTIGILLCKGKNDVVAEYALKGYNNAIGVSDYQLSKAIPNELKSSLPQIEDLENELKMENE